MGQYLCRVRVSDGTTIEITEYAESTWACREQLAARYGDENVMSYHSADSYEPPQQNWYRARIMMSSGTSTEIEFSAESTWAAMRLMEAQYGASNVLSCHSI